MKQNALMLGQKPVSRWLGSLTRGPAI